MGGARLEETKILNKKYGLGYQAKAANPCPAIPGYLGHPSYEAVVPTADLADIINPIIARAELEAERSNSGWQDGRQAEEPAPLEALHDHTAKARGCTSDAAARRLYSIRHKQSRCTTHSWAEAIFDALDIHDNDLLVFPSGVTYAVEMAEAWADDELQAHRLVRSLVHFTRGFFADIDEVCEWVDGRMMVATRDNPEEKRVADELAKLRIANRITPDEYREQMARLPELAAEVAA